MKILICGPEGSGKTSLAKPLAELLNALYVNKDTYSEELRGYIDGLVAAGKIVVIDKRCNNADAVEYLSPDYVIWMDTVDSSTEKPSTVNYHVAEWFHDTHAQLVDIVQTYMKRNNL